MHASTVNASCTDLNSSLDKTKRNKESISSDTLTGRTILKASHPNLVKGSRQVQRTEVEASKHPNGQGLLRRMKQKVLKDLKNKLVAGPVSFKPNHSGPCGGVSNIFGDGVITKGKAQLNKAFSNSELSLKSSEGVCFLDPTLLDRPI